MNPTESQVKLLLQLRKVAPQITYQEISDQTGIQLTRVYRLFHHGKIRLDEYEKIQKLITNKASRFPHHEHYFKTTMDFFQLASPEEIYQMIQRLEQKISLKSTLNQF